MVSSTSAPSRRSRLPSMRSDWAGSRVSARMLSSIPVFLAGPAIFAKTFNAAKRISGWAACGPASRSWNGFFVVTIGHRAEKAEFKIGRSSVQLPVQGVGQGGSWNFPESGGPHRESPGLWISIASSGTEPGPRLAPGLHPALPRHEIWPARLNV